MIYYNYFVLISKTINKAFTVYNLETMTMKQTLQWQKLQYQKHPQLPHLLLFLMSKEKCSFQVSKYLQDVY